MLFRRYSFLAETEEVFRRFAMSFRLLLFRFHVSSFFQKGPMGSAVNGFHTKFSISESNSVFTAIWPYSLIAPSPSSLITSWLHSLIASFTKGGGLRSTPQGEAAFVEPFVDHAIELLGDEAITRNLLVNDAIRLYGHMFVNCIAFLNIEFGAEPIYC